MRSLASRHRGAAPLAFVVLVTCLFTGLFVPTAARASCVGPRLAAGPAGSTPTPEVQSSTATPVTLKVGAGAVVRGLGFVDGCNDAQECTAGCGGGCHGNPVAPLTKISLVLVIGNSEYALANADATGDQGEVHWDVTLPATMPTGAGTFEAHWTQNGSPSAATVDVVVS